MHSYPYLLIPLLHAILLFILFILVEVKKIGGKPLMLIGALVDMSFNLTWASLLFLQLPHQVFFSQRVSKNQLLAGWRGKLAQLICKRILNRFLPNHCQQG